MSAYENAVRTELTQQKNTLLQANINPTEISLATLLSLYDLLAYVRMADMAQAGKILDHLNHTVRAHFAADVGRRAFLEKMPLIQAELPDNFEEANVNAAYEIITNRIDLMSAIDSSGDKTDVLIVCQVLLGIVLSLDTDWFSPDFFVTQATLAAEDFDECAADVEESDYQLQPLRLN